MDGCVSLCVTIYIWPWLCFSRQGRTGRCQQACSGSHCLYKRKRTALPGVSAIHFRYRFWFCTTVSTYTPTSIYRACCLIIYELLLFFNHTSVVSLTIGWADFQNALWILFRVCFKLGHSNEQCNVPVCICVYYKDNGSVWLPYHWNIDNTIPEQNEKNIFDYIIQIHGIL